MDTFGEYVWQIRSSECNPSGRATLPAILNLLQEAASLNAEALGFSKSNFAAEGENISWVLTRLKVRMFSYPGWEEKINVVTWPRGGRKITAHRDFEIYSSSGERIAIATSEWMIINLATRKIVPVPEDVFKLANDVRMPVFGDEPFSKLRWDCRAVSKDTLEFRARRSDIDLNGHVNNVHYVEWLLESLPQDMELCRDFEIVFKAETMVGEKILGECVEVAPNEFIHRISSLDGADKVIAKTVFAL